jgi:hypothetical protein
MSEKTVGFISRQSRTYDPLGHLLHAERNTLPTPPKSSPIAQSSQTKPLT